MVLGTTVQAEARYKRALKLVDERVVLARPGAEAVERVGALDGMPLAHFVANVGVVSFVLVVSV